MADDTRSGSDGASQRGKVIDLRGHRAAERALDALLAADPSSHSLPTATGDALALGPPLLAAVVRRLDATRPQSIEALGRLVAAYSDRSEAIGVLLRTAADRRSPDARRMGAMLVLEYFLGVLPPDDFLSSLNDPIQMAVHLMTGALDESTGSPTLLRDYLGALVAQPPELLHAMLSAIVDGGGPRAAEPIRLLALNLDSDLRHSAIEALASLATPDAVEALSLLPPGLPDESARQVGRALQKLRLSGVEVNEPLQADERCRAMVGAIDSEGGRLIWLVAPIERRLNAPAVFLALYASDTAGVEEALGAPRLATAHLPAAAPVGTLHETVPPLVERLIERIGWDLPGTACLEVPYGYGLNLVREAVLRNWEAGNPLPADYQVLNVHFWRYGANLVEERPYVPASMVDHQPGPANDAEVLVNPPFDGWHLDTEGVRLVAQDIAALDTGLPSELGDESWRVLLPALIRLAHEEFTPEMRARYSRRLKHMSDWLRFAGRRREADRAALASRTMLQSPPEVNLLALRLVQRGIMAALSRLTVGPSRLL